MEEQSLNISIFDVADNDALPTTPFQQATRNMADIISEMEALFTQEVIAQPESNNHYLLLDPTAQLQEVEKILGQPATLVHTDPVILSIQAPPTMALPPNVQYHKTKTSLQMLPNTKLFAQNLAREAINHNTRTPQQWKAHLNEKEVTRVCSLFMQNVHTAPPFITKWVQSIQ